MAYATTPFHGKLCRVEKNNVVMEFTNGWTLNVNVDMADTSRQGQNWKETIPGLAGWTGSFNVQYVMGNTEQAAIFNNIVAATPGTKLTDMKFLLESLTSGFSGDLFITSVSIPTAVGGVVTATVNFQGNGPLTMSAAQ